MAETIQRPDRTIQWISADHPLVYGSVPKGRLLKIGEPARSDASAKTLLAMGRLARIPTRLRTQDIRRGAAVDAAASNAATKLKGFATTDALVAKSLGHIPRSTAHGITQQYMGDPRDSMYSLRAEEAFEDIRAPVQTTVPYPSFEPKELRDVMTKFCNEQGWDSTSRAQREKARREVHRARDEQWREDAQRGLIKPEVIAAVRKPSVQLQIT